MHVGKSIMHCCMSIRGTLENYRRKKMDGLFRDKSGKHVSDRESRDYLYDCLAKGWRVIPLGDCDNFDYQEGCKGHSAEEA